MWYHAVLYTECIGKWSSWGQTETFSIVVDMLACCICLRDYHDPDEVAQEDLNDEDYTPAMEGKSTKPGKHPGRGRGMQHAGEFASLPIDRRVLGPDSVSWYASFWPGRPRKEHTYGKVTEKPTLEAQQHPSETEAQVQKGNSLGKEGSGVDCAGVVTIMPAVGEHSFRLNRNMG